MLRKQFIAVLVIGATWGVIAAQTPPSPPPTRPAEVVSVPAAPANQSPATSEPDKPSGSAAARDAELAKQVTPLGDPFLNNAGVTRAGRQTAGVAFEPRWH
jgi:hypothetical protein